MDCPWLTWIMYLPKGYLTWSPDQDLCARSIKQEAFASLRRRRHTMKVRYMQTYLSPHQYGKWSFIVGIPSWDMVIFHSYVKLPEGIIFYYFWSEMLYTHDGFNCSLISRWLPQSTHWQTGHPRLKYLMSMPMRYTLLNLKIALANASFIDHWWWLTYWTCSIAVSYT